MLKIGSLYLNDIAFLAPLSGITNLPFRLLSKQGGAALVFTEMISSSGIYYQSPTTIQMLESTVQEKPVCVQLYGSDPVILRFAAQKVQSMGADMVNINFGCAVKKITKTGSGVALMKELRKAEAIIRTVRDAIHIPFTIKMRSGWDYQGTDAIELSKIAEDNGVDAIILHPRTATQGFHGSANWSLIQQLKETISIPVVGNGDILCADDAMQMLKQTHCDAVMIGRAAQSNPYIFSQINALVNHTSLPKFDISHQFNLMKTYLELTIMYLGEIKACQILRSRLGWLSKELPYSTRFRERMKHIGSKQEATDIIHEYWEFVMNCQFNTDYTYTYQFS
ncbi:MAG: tRNA dihydrouridine synthase DusB [Desulfobacterales bacterium]|nr:tRNA dihydrouridine synthase DusB [Desulfobacterales bacterium]